MPKWNPQMIKIAEQSRIIRRMKELVVKAQLQMGNGYSDFVMDTLNEMENELNGTRTNKADTN